MDQPAGEGHPLRAEGVTRTVVVEADVVPEPDELDPLAHADERRTTGDLWSPPVTAGAPAGRIGMREIRRLVGKRMVMASITGVRLMVVRWATPRGPPRANPKPTRSRCTATTSSSSWGSTLRHPTADTAPDTALPPAAAPASRRADGPGHLGRVVGGGGEVDPRRPFGSFLRNWSTEVVDIKLQTNFRSVAV